MPEFREADTFRQIEERFPDLARAFANGNRELNVSFNTLQEKLGRGKRLKITPEAPEGEAAAAPFTVFVLDAYIVVRAEIGLPPVVVKLVLDHPPLFSGDTILSLEWVSRWNAIVMRTKDGERVRRKIMIESA